MIDPLHVIPMSPSSVADLIERARANGVRAQAEQLAAATAGRVRAARLRRLAKLGAP